MINFFWIDVIWKSSTFPSFSANFEICKYSQVCNGKHEHVHVCGNVWACVCMCFWPKGSYFIYFWKALEFPNHLSLTLAFYDNWCGFSILLIFFTSNLKISKLLKFPHFQYKSIKTWFQHIKKTIRLFLGSFQLLNVSYRKKSTFLIHGKVRQDFKNLKKND